MSVKVKKFVIQAKVIEGVPEKSDINTPKIDYNMLNLQKAEILEECKELVEDILDKKASRI